MKRFLTIFIILFTLILIFNNYPILLNSSIDAINLWKSKVFPYLFIMIVLIDLLNSLNIAKFFKNPSHYLIILSCFSGSPSSSIIISSLYKDKVINKTYANISLMYTSFSNPLFLYTILISIFKSNIVALKLIIILYSSNLLIYFYYKRYLPNINYIANDKKFDITSSIKKSLNTCLFVLGTIIFYLTITNIFLYTFKVPKVLSIFFKGILEMTQGLNSLININIFGKECIAMFFLTFQGLSIHTQVKYILDENGLDYNYYLKGRIISSFLVLIYTVTAKAIWIS